MKKTVKVVLIATVGMVLVGVGYLSRAQSQEVPKDALLALQYFWDVDCELKEPGEALNRVLVYKAALEPHLIATLRNGPDQQALSEVDKSLEEQWSRRDAYLKNNPNLGLKENELQIAKGVTREAYIKQGREQVIRKYREKSAIALAAIGSPEAIKTLREVSEKGDRDLQTVIQAALARYQKK
ncbi:MAG: hypothetical protein ACREA9_07795 [Pyrinomonadaceae bacterium]